jgi:DNA-binding NtrC family response regulator
MRVMENANWPGNVRELAHVVERLVVLCEPNHPIDAALVQETLGLVPSGEAPPPQPLGASIDDAVSGYERALIVAALDRAGGVLTKAAIDLRVDRTTLSKRCKRLGIQVGR